MLHIPYMDTGEYARLNRLYADSFSPVKLSEDGSASNGLVNRLKTDRKRSPVKITSFQNMLEMKVPKKAPNGKRGKRQRITEFSSSSRRNMMKLIHKLKGHTGGYFLTMTYDGLFTSSPEQIKRDIATMRKRIMRRFPDCGAIWRMELKRRKSGESKGLLVPHYHVLLFGVKQAQIDDLPIGEDKELSMSAIQRLRLWVSRAWNEVINGSVKHLKAGTNCRAILTMRHAFNYVSKYVGKKDEETPNEDEPQFWGRRWGTFGKLDISPCMVIHVPYEDVPELKRILRGILIGRSRKREIEAKANGGKYRHRKRRGYWRSHSMNTDKAGCSVLGFGDADRETLIKMFIVLSAF